MARCETANGIHPFRCLQVDAWDMAISESSQIFRRCHKARAEIKEGLG